MATVLQEILSGTIAPTQREVAAIRNFLRHNGFAGGPGFAELSGPLSLKYLRAGHKLTLKQGKELGTELTLAGITSGRIVPTQKLVDAIRGFFTAEGLSSAAVDRFHLVAGHRVTKAGAMQIRDAFLGIHDYVTAFDLVPHSFPFLGGVELWANGVAKVGGGLGSALDSITKPFGLSKATLIFAGIGVVLLVLLLGFAKGK